MLLCSVYWKHSPSAHTAITSFLGSFVLIRFKLLDARDHVPRPRTIPPTAPATFSEKPAASRIESAPPSLSHSTRSNGSEHHGMPGLGTVPPFMQTAQTDFLRIFQDVSGHMSDTDGRVLIHQVQPFWCCARRDRDGGGGGAGTELEPPVRLLSACHSLSVAMAGVGFVLALLGILTFAWTALPVSLGAFASACLGTCILAIVATLSCA